MKSFSRSDIGIIKMETNPPEEIINSGYRIINNYDNSIYEYIKMEWVKIREACREDFKNIPLVF